MSLTTVDFLIATNEDWRDALTLTEGEAETPVNLAGSSFVAQLRQPAEALHIILEASTANGMLQITAPTTDGTVAWNVPPEVLRLIPPGDYAYDMVWTNADGIVDRFVAGKVTIQRGITR
ncbi:hypothetical protein [Antarcticirhabdus aurantiaca]|uniref:Uncharacterized protein n=1 Tax=Antarcticirhabdus aurantiaca TaxID=2606717 RepID=A0ACD4NKA4_9HYPH|nr:hypothetical protein [Antarcticirhabdus aurantiaca]WAJ27140.1 hypothetical protein OXU80_20120 [Jeongeuplla avenae]